MKKVLSLALLGATTSVFALYAEHASLYKDPRIMGMGGANVAVGTYSTSVFSNPAGLATIKKSHGFVVDVLNIGMSGSADGASFAQDIQGVDTSASDATTQMTDVLKKYDGKNIHIGVNNYTSISKNSDAFAWSIGILQAADINFMTHTQGGSQAFLATSSRAYGGVVLGIAKPYETDYGRLDIGLSAKYIVQKSYEGGISIGDLVSKDPATTLQNRLVNSSGLGIDLGLAYRPWVDNYWHPAFGLSVMNMGSIGMGGVYGGQPMTVNAGLSITPEFPVFSKFVVAVDYVDMLNANKLRLYNGTNANGSFTYTDYNENDPMKRLRVGVGMGLVDTSWLALTLNGGLYQSAYTAGIDLEFLLVKLNVATYQEQIGTSATSITDRRYMVRLGLGW